jgi:hypothetical protein
MENSWGQGTAEDSDEKITLNVEGQYSLRGSVV